MVTCKYSAIRNFWVTLALNSRKAIFLNLILLLLPRTQDSDVNHVVRPHAIVFAIKFATCCTLLGKPQLILEAGSVVSRATGYGLDGLGFETRWVLDFPHLYRLALGPTTMGTRSFPGVKNARGVKLTPHPF